MESKLHYELSINYENTGNLNKALYHHKLYVLNKDSFISEKESEKQLRLEMEFKLDQKRRQIKAEKENELYKEKEKNRQQKRLRDIYLIIIIVVFIIIGILLLIIGSHFFVDSAVIIAKKFGVQEEPKEKETELLKGSNYYPPQP